MAIRPPDLVASARPAPLPGRAPGPEIAQPGPRHVDGLAEKLAFLPRTLKRMNARAGLRLDEHDLADLHQDIAMIVFAKWGRLESGKRTFEAWVQRIASFEFRNALRRVGLRRRRSLALERIELLSGDSTSHESQRLAKSLSRLSETQAQVIRRRIFERASFADIAKTLDLPVGTVKARYYRGLRCLRVALTGGAEDRNPKNIEVRAALGSRRT